MPEAVQPQPHQNGVTGPAAPVSPTDKLIESTLDFLEQEHKGAENDNGKPPVRRRAPGVEEPAIEPPDEEPKPAGPTQVPDDEELDDDDENDDEYESPEDVPLRGSQTEPFKVKDLPSDKYIEIKVDGEKQVVALSELAAGYIREAAFNQRVNKTKELSDQAEAAVKQAHEMQARVRDEFRSFVRDPDQIYDFFMADPERERVFEAAASKYAALLRHFRQNPQERLSFERQRDVERLTQERQRFEAQKQAELEQKQAAEARQRAEAIFKPGWEAGLKKAGFPTPTKALYEEVLLRCNQRARSGQPVTTEDVAEFTTRACKLLELVPASQKPRPAPARVNGAPAPKPRREKDPWAGKTKAQKRSDPDFFLQSLRPRDFRL